MKNLLYRLLPNRWLLGKVFWGLVVASIVVAAFFWGRYGSNSAKAIPPIDHNLTAITSVFNRGTADYKQRVVAYLYGNMALTREDLGEYLITRYGMDRLQ